MADQTTGTPWEMFRSELTSYLAGSGAKTDAFSGLQVVTTPMDAVWNNEVYGTWLAWETMANIIPAWGPVYKPQPGNRVDDAYFAFLTNIQPEAKDPEAAEQAQALGTQLSRAVDRLNGAFKAMGSDWTQFRKDQEGLPPNRQQTFDQWFARSWGPKISTLQGDYNNIATQWLVAANNAGGGYQSLAVALQDYNNPAYQLAETDENGQELSWRTWSLTPALGDFVKEAKSGKGSALNLTINTKTTTTDKTSWSAQASGGFFDGFLGIRASGGYTRSTVNTSASDFTMQFSSPAFTTINVQPGQWFHLNVVQQFQTGPFIPTGPFGSSTGQHFFGQGGTFNLMVAQVYVAYQPRVSGTLDQTSFSSLQEGWNGGLGISIGPFSFGGSTTGSHDHAEFNGATRQFSVTSSSPHPQIVGINCVILPGQ